ncbi:polyprenyl synthetase family protein [Methanoregula sp.]|uniref:polyprenyl synthetase family protein n=1 Tax=Methanoregula sp. TaxID=2052170 RepID=UPI00236D22C8|nr:polyprenyl synthetase family protein [Methanoregula sp.]MDD1687903.1 polyprenyl synthetase family protein [Methanoregula sp.]
MSELSPYLKSVAQQIDRMIDRDYVKKAGELNKASAHLLTAGGKRLRPAVVMLAADAVKQGSSRELMQAALALEVTHTFTLIHDDIMDDDCLRRGVPTVHTKWDMPTGILAGDVLYSRAFEHISSVTAKDDAKVRAIKMLAKACADICEGQHMDMSFEHRTDVTEAEYMEMVRMKTGVLYAAAAGIGATLAGGTEAQVNALYTFGQNTGIAFQIQDDLIDLLTPSEKSGKDQASDLREGKQTIIMIKAREKGLDLLKYKRDLSKADIAAAIRELTDSGVLADVKKIATDLVADSNKHLSILPPSKERQLLMDVGEFFVTRSH